MDEAPSHHGDDRGHSQQAPMKMVIPAEPEELLIDIR